MLPPGKVTLPFTVAVIIFVAHPSASTNFGESLTGEVLRILLPRTWVNKGMNKGRGCYYAPALVRAKWRYTLEGT